MGLKKYPQLLTMFR